MNPQDMELLKKYTAVAKKIIFESERFKKFLQMLGSPEGALQAVSTVLSAIEKHKPVPPQIKTQLAVNAYLVMVELARDVTGHAPDANIMKRVMESIKASMGQSEEMGEPTQEPPAQEAMELAHGLIGQKMGLA